MGYPEDQLEIKGIGMATASKIALEFPNMEDLALALVSSEEFSLGEPVREILQEGLKVEDVEVEPPVPEAPEVKKPRPMIRSSLRQPIRVSFGKRQFMVPTHFVAVPEEFDELFTSSHFRSLCLKGVILKATE